MITAMGLCLAAGCQTSYDADKDIFDRFYLTNLRHTTSSDLLPVIQKPDRELLGQNSNVIASFGDDHDGLMSWFNMVVFDDQNLTAARKYAFLIDEKTHSFYIMKAPQKLRIDAQAVVDPMVLAGPYADDNARRIAVLQWLGKQFASDSRKVAGSGQILSNSAMVVRQALTGILDLMTANPAQAAGLSEYDGVKFDHMNLGPGHIRMLIEDDIVKLKIKAGKDSAGFQTQPDVINM